jgi:hypothetical protein
VTNEIDSKRFLILLLQRGELSFADFLNLVQDVDPTWQQQEFVEAVDGGKRRISVRSGHGANLREVWAWHG